MSLATTVLVIIVIFGGVVLLTKDLTFLSRNLLKPLRDLADDMKSIAHLQLAGVDCVEEEEEDTNNGKETAEVLLIRRTFSNMKKAIKSWGKYVPWPVVQLLLRANVEAELEVEERDVTMFFSDIVGFTTIVEGVEPDKSLLLLSRYFNDMSKVIDDHGGVVLEFIGDAIQCIYGAPLTNEHHPQSAVEASLRMLSALRKMKDWSRAKGLPEVDIRCGIHTGRVLVGNMGFHSRMKFGIVGEESNIPSKLEELNKAYKTHILISQSTFERLEPNAFLLRPIDYVHLRQRIEGAPGELIYEVLPPSWKRSSLVVNRLITLHTNAIAEYRSRKFASARQNFEQVNALVLEMTAEEDGPSLLMARRCEKCLQRSPQESWDGTWESVESEPLVEL